MAAELGIKCDDDTIAEALLADIEDKLGDKAVTEQARWYVMSVLRNLYHEEWASPESSGLAVERQYALATACLTSDAFAKSLRTVLKDQSAKYTLVDFRSAKQSAKGILSKATQAFRIAQSVLQDEELLHRAGKTVAVESRLREQAQPFFDSNVSTAANRRAARRGYLNEGFLHAFLDSALDERKQQSKESNMSEKEYAQLEQVMTNKVPQLIQRNWNYRTTDDRKSLLLGIIAGIGFFSLVLLFFL